MIHFVGAGCGAEDLITVRGMRLLQEADVIVYAGSLVNPKLTEYGKEGCKVWNSAEMTLEEVMDVLIAAEKDGLNCVRLHTGDPCMYGAIKEQMDMLDEHGIDYDVCPGVTAAFGAAAALCVEYTLPTVSQSLILTRMEGKTAVPERESIRSFASHHASMAIYLSSSLTGQLKDELIAGGYSEDTPAAICYKVSWEDQELYPCTVGTLPETAKAHGIYKTAIILVGDAIAPDGYEKSRLYAADFSTEFRKASK
ncbi:MAG: precorrin-4 C(11)-methyltransferase [Lachnospiraceae bacterium]|nr:precorrin-4 C(11)-methyltransferase [Lachnospiraceae bacterium]